MCKPILVTGAHRSGTTWVGRMISNSPLVNYVHEPFNIEYSPYDIKPKYWFQYITEKNDKFISDQIEQLVTTISSQNNRNLKKWLKFLKTDPKKQRVLIKDPIAVFSAQWLASRFNMDVIIMIRHPAAFVDSIKEQNWTHNFSHFLNQPLLMKEYLFPFEDQIKKFTHKKIDIFDQAILLWKLIYHVVSKYQEKQKNWLYVKHEDLSGDPVAGFGKIFKFLNIRFSKEIRKKIEQHSSHTNPVEGGVHSIKRNSSAIIKKWKNKFTDEEIKKIRDSVESISKKFYSEEEW